MNNHSLSKKTTGSFYTPTYIVDFMVDRIFYYLNLEGHMSMKSFQTFKKSLNNLTFCDPSLGNGNFIIGVLKRIWNDLKTFTTIRPENKNAFFRNFFEHNIYGIELNPKALEECKEKIIFFFPILYNCSPDNLKIGNSIVDTDSIEILAPEDAEKIRSFNWIEQFKPRTTFDVIIGNPPYYNLKKMALIDQNAKILFHYLKTSNIWSDYHRSSSDIYYYFIFQAFKYLSDGGLLSFILPNYWIENKYADILREKISEKQILELLDLSNFKIFKDNSRWLNITNCITLIQNSSPTHEVKIARNIPKMILENYKKEKNSIDRYFFEIEHTNLNKEKWILSPNLPFLKKLEDKGRITTLDSEAKIFQGMSPGVKDIFVMSQSKARELMLEKDVLVPFITNSGIKRWIIDTNSLKAAILPSQISDLNNYPNVKNYLEHNCEKLLAGPDRERLLLKEKIRWFDYSVYRNLEAFNNNKEKIMVPYRSLTPRFGLDENCTFGATDIYAILPKNHDDLHFLLGILNSEIVHFWYTEAGKRKGKMLEFFSDPLKNVPIPKTDEKKTLSAIVKDLIRASKNSSLNKKCFSNLEEELNIEVARLYGVDYTYFRNKIFFKSNNSNK